MEPPTNIKELHSFLGLIILTFLYLSRLCSRSRSLDGGLNSRKHSAKWRLWWPLMLSQSAQITILVSVLRSMQVIISWVLLLSRMEDLLLESCLRRMQSAQTDSLSRSLEDLCSSMEPLHLICQCHSRNKAFEQFVTAYRRTTGRSISTCHNKSVHSNQQPPTQIKWSQIRNRQCSHSGHRCPKLVHNKKNHKNKNNTKGILKILIWQQNWCALMVWLWFIFQAPLLAELINWSTATQYKTSQIWVGGEWPAFLRYDQLISTVTVVIPQRVCRRLSQKFSRATDSQMPFKW